MSKLNKRDLAFLGMLNPVNMKFRCLQAWCLAELNDAEKRKGETVIEDGEGVIDQLKNIVSRIKNKGNTHEILSHLALKDKRIKKYYNSIAKNVNRYFSLNDHWIPSMIVLSVLQEYTLRGHKDFNDIDFTKLLSQFDVIDKETKKKHYECAFDIVETISKMKVGIR